jgi:uncharacterized protein (DUF362 family)
MIQRLNSERVRSAIPRRLLEAEAIVQTCCLKSHRFGGQFTLSLKNSVGLVRKHIGSGGYNFTDDAESAAYASPIRDLMLQSG